MISAFLSSPTVLHSSAEQIHNILDTGYRIGNMCESADTNIPISSFMMSKLRFSKLTGVPEAETPGLPIRLRIDPLLAASG